MGAELTPIPSGSPETDGIRRVTADTLCRPGETYLLRLPGREPLLIVSPFHDRVWTGFEHHYLTFGQ